MARPRKHARNAMLIELRKENKKKWTLRKLGEEFNLSYVRVKEILDEAELSTVPQ